MVSLEAALWGCFDADGGRFEAVESEVGEREYVAAFELICNEGGGGRLIFCIGPPGLVATAVAIGRNGMDGRAEALKRLAHVPPPLLRVQDGIRHSAAISIATDPSGLALGAEQLGQADVGLSRSFVVLETMLRPVSILRRGRAKQLRAKQMDKLSTMAKTLAQGLMTILRGAAMRCPEVQTRGLASCRSGRLAVGHSHVIRIFAEYSYAREKSHNDLPRGAISRSILTL